MTILEHLEDLEYNETRLLAAVMQAEEIVESSPVCEDRSESEVTYFSGMEALWVVTETPERLAELHSDLSMLLDAGCDVQESAYVTKRSPYLTGRLEGDLN